MNNPTPQSWVVDYPVVAYKSFLPDDSDIVIGNFARREDLQLAVNLGNWNFLSFVGFAQEMTNSRLSRTNV